MELWVVEPGRIGYGPAVALQDRIRQAREQDRVPDVLLLLEHDPVITMGRGTDPAHLLAGADRLAAAGIELHETGRGGDITYHGPGQVVGYPILDLNRHGRDVHRYLRRLEESLIAALAGWGLRGERAPGLTGVWVGRDKVAAIGVGIRRWVTWHGFALNVTTDLDAFRLIVPCGIRGDRGVTSLLRLLGREVPPQEVHQALTAALAEEFGLRPTQTTLDELEAALGQAVA